MTRKQIEDQWECTRTDFNDKKSIHTVFGTCVTWEYSNLLGEWYVYEDVHAR